MNDDVMIQLKRHLASAEQIDVSRYQFVNMERVREAAGHLWPELRQRAFIASRSILERRIAEDDLIIQCESGYLVIFKALSGRQAQALTNKVRAELEEFFLGEAFINQLGVEAKSEQLSVEEFAATLASADVDEPRQARSVQTEPDQNKAFSLFFQPVWDQKREAVASYFVRAVSAEIDRPFQARATDLMLSDLKPDARCAVDMAVLEESVEALDELLRSGSRCALIVPAGYTSLSNPRTRSQYVTALAALPTQLRQLIWVQIKDAPADPPSNILDETLRILRAQSPKLFVHVRTDWPYWSRFEHAFVDAIGADFPERLSESDRLDIERLMASARRGDSLVYFNRIESWESFRAATQTNAHLFSGRAVGQLPHPAPPYRLSRARLLNAAL
ncbi:MAG: hypothetical protein CMH91_15460 [Oceanicaulis sp.]|uniref:hypothetical protein n=1 Tax=unclassified Oceanicaulis TaxID=2632123 RepID=UPI000C64F55D|nr:MULTISPECIES: hypothetical protein [unclassified Oceanicaulis]MAB68977.1 hypothetical protein [Oceanicaulis sp.]MBC40444.1 hypothetical protein [Oceanicaulis sp.]MBG35705.1 hypothetical protein [Oceanicaulis sp.]HBU60987.1 hypothetical protein [Oceanicaulis sp.]